MAIVDSYIRTVKITSHTRAPQEMEKDNRELPFEWNTLLALGKDRKEEKEKRIRGKEEG